MTLRRLLRFLVEALFLAALAAALVLADASVPVIAGGMAAGWLVVVLYEWAGLRNRPHFGRGLPPRYYVPQVSLPPPRPLEQLPRFPVPPQRDEAPTLIATPAQRDELLGDWPAVASSAIEETIVVNDLLVTPFGLDPAADPWDDLPPDVGELEPAVPEPVAEIVVEEIVVEEVAVEVEVVEVVEVVAEAVPAPAVEPARRKAAVKVRAQASSRLARHWFDPLGDAQAQRRWGKRQAEEGAFVEVPDRPARLVLPSRASEGGE